MASKKDVRYLGVTHCLHLQEEKKCCFFLNRNHTKRGRVEDIHKLLSLEVAALLLQHCVMSLRTFLSVSSVMFRRLQTLSAMKELFCSLAAERVLSLRTFSHPSGTSYWCFHSSPVLSLGLIVDPIFFFFPFCPNCLRVMKNSAAVPDRRRVRHFYRFSAVCLEKFWVTFHSKSPLSLR